MMKKSKVTQRIDFTRHNNAKVFSIKSFIELRRTIVAFFLVKRGH